MSKYQILFSSQFKKDFKKYLKQPKEKTGYSGCDHHPDQ